VNLPAFDTDVLINAVNETSEFHISCARQLREARESTSSSWLTWNVCYEFLRVSTHPNVLRPPLNTQTALSFITELLNSPGVRIIYPTARHLEVLTQTLREFPWVHSNRFFDLHTAILMRESGVSEICTLDNGFRAFPFLTVIDPRQ
jgi:predicted nucleic acid-binding protein